MVIDKAIMEKVKKVKDMSLEKIEGIPIMIYRYLPEYAKQEFYSTARDLWDNREICDKLGIDTKTLKITGTEEDGWPLLLAYNYYDKFSKLVEPYIADALLEKQQNKS